MDESTIAELFKECDVRDRNYLEPLDLLRVCPQLSNDEVKYIFDQLDTNKDGKVTKAEFMAGFNRALHAGESAGFRGIQRRASIECQSPLLLINEKLDEHELIKLKSCEQQSKNENIDENDADRPLRQKPEYSSIRRKKEGKGNEIPKVVYNLEPDASMEAIPCQEEVLSLYEQLQRSGVPVLLSQYEKVIAGVCKEIEEQKRLNENLQTVYQKEKERYTRQMNEVESEIDQQVAEAQEKARREEREKMEREKELMRQELQAEIVELQTNIKRLEKVESILAETGDTSKKVLEMKTKMQELTKENRVLKSSLTEKKTEMAVIKTKLARLRNEYDEKCLDLMSEKDNLLLYLKEKDHLERQMQLLYEANTQLHDTNDNLRTTLESRHAFFRQCNMRTPSPVSSLGSSISHSRQTSLSSVASSRSSVQNFQSPESQPRISPIARPNQLTLPAKSSFRRPAKNSSFETDDDVDSGMVTRGSDTACSGDSSALEEEFYKRMRMQSRFTPQDVEESDEETLEMDSVSMQGESDRQRSSRELIDNMSTLSSNQTVLIKSGGYERKPLTAKLSASNGPPERTFRVVMAGDQAVGKSSLVMRLVKDQFVPSIQSTLGVDFHVKSMNIDGHNVAVQLWDTAGQERFRSLCKSYFRRADGAILVYDCTCEHSFLNVRNWIQTIQESAPKKIPILLCANKVDLRIQSAAEGKRCVQKEDGEKLANTFEAIFIETSAKEGTNVNLASYELARRLLAAEDSEVRSTLVLTNPPEQKKSSTCSCK